MKWLFGLAVAAVCVGVVAPGLPAHAQGGKLDTVGHAGGQRGAIAANGRVLARGVGAAVELHAAGARSPALGTVLLGAMVHDIALASTRAYMATDGGLEVLDISDAAHPRQIASLPLDGAMAVAVRGPVAYVAIKAGTLAVVDVSDPLHPQPHSAKQRRSASFDRPLAIRLAGPRLYILDAGFGVRQYDLADPLDPVERDTVAAEQPLDPEAPALLAADGERAVARDGDRLRLLDFTDPMDPRNEDLIGPEREVGRVAAMRGKRVVVAGMEELWVMDVSRPNHSRVLGTTELT